ncbi:hypothetical protein PLEOSDRAFT_155479 [Pleurotus ostreatus PC15]|uniref:Uncharacterized protein n=1 Tax=Pleurotus ostreatus (strain PC15) TaxID=1137138 RepID=A0A067P4N8_PLEO1|nr:hypothetical protein PLEOSDRAFT_155479 [Pleurotus ostreatus PC15]
MQQQGYQPFPYYHQALYPPQTPHLGANNGAANGYTLNPYYPMQQNPYVAAAAPASGPTQMNPAPLARPRKYTQPEPKHNRNGFPPLRSAMKQPARPDATPLRRQRTISGKGPDGLARHRTRSNPTPVEEARPEFIPIHLYLSFHGNNELRVENGGQPAVTELRRLMNTLWPPGIELDDIEGYIWRVRFAGSPWNLSGPDSAYDIIVQIFTLFARRGYTFRTFMKTGSPSPRLIFECTNPDKDSRFFVAYFSRTGRCITLVSPPAVVNAEIGHRLEVALPGAIESDQEVEGGFRVIRLRDAYGGPLFGKHLFIAYILKIMEELNFLLEATIPLGRRVSFGLGLGLGPKREIFVFKGFSR